MNIKKSLLIFTMGISIQSVYGSDNSTLPPYLRGKDLSHYNPKNIPYWNPNWLDVDDIPLDSEIAAIRKAENSQQPTKEKRFDLTASANIPYPYRNSDWKRSSKDLKDFGVSEEEFYKAFSNLKVASPNHVFAIKRYLMDTMLEALDTLEKMEYIS